MSKRTDKIFSDLAVLREREAQVLRAEATRRQREASVAQATRPVPETVTFHGTAAHTNLDGSKTTVSVVLHMSPGRIIFPGDTIEFTEQKCP